MKESHDIKSLNINVPKKSHFTSKGNLYHCIFDLITNKRLSETERTVIQQLIKNDLLLTENDSKSTVSNLIKMCEDYQFEIARLKKELREKKLDEDFVPLKGIIKSEDDEYLFVQYDILGIIKIPKLKLTIFKLKNSDECFYKTFGFQWSPSNDLISKANYEIMFQVAKNFVSCCAEIFTKITSLFSSPFNKEKTDKNDK